MDSFYKVLNAEQHKQAMLNQYNFDHPGEGGEGWGGGWGGEGGRRREEMVRRDICHTMRPLWSTLLISW